MLRALACCGTLLVVTSQIAAAEWHLTPLIGLTFKGNTSLIDVESGTSKVHRHFGGSVALLGRGLFGVEGIFVYTPGFFQSDLFPESERLVTASRTMALMGNAVLTTPRRWTEYGLRPFVSGGLGLLRASADYRERGLLPITSNLLGFNIGGGAIGFFSQRTGVRFDLRYYANVHQQQQGPIAFGGVHLSYMTASVGVVLRR